MPRFRLTIAYDGTDFCGWQKQHPPDWSAIAALGKPPDAQSSPSHTGTEAPTIPRRALRTVQGVVEDAIRLVVREPILLQGASRTDAGVHALAQVGAFTTTDGAERGRGWPPDRGTTPLLRAINARLPDDVVITGVDVTTPDFDPIGHAVAKGYSYSILCGHDRPMWDRRYVYRCRHALDADAMNAAAAYMVGEHDFESLAATGHGRQTTVRTIDDCRVERLDAQRLRIHVSGNGFLWNMVRILGGTLVQAGLGRLSPADIPAILAAKDRRRAGPTLPPEGLRLEWIRYTSDPPANSHQNNSPGQPMV